MRENDDIEVVESYTEEVTEDGSVVAEDVIAAVDVETGEAVIDDVVAVTEPDGSGFVEETITAVDYKQLGEVTNTARPSINNGVLMTLDHSQWIVAGTSYLTGLKLDKASKLAAPTGQKLVLKVNGREVPITAGSYRGAIEVGTVHAP